MTKGMKIKAIIEKGTDGLFSVYTDDVQGVFASGLTEQEAKEEFMEILEEQAEYYMEKHGETPEWGISPEVEYEYSLTGFFLAFPFINATEFAKCIGINPSLMRQYKNGLAFASEKQRKLIQQSYDDILKRMNSVSF